MIINRPVFLSFPDVIPHPPTPLVIRAGGRRPPGKRIKQLSLALSPCPRPCRGRGSPTGDQGVGMREGGNTQRIAMEFGTVVIGLEKSAVPIDKLA